MSLSGLEVTRTRHYPSRRGILLTAVAIAVVLLTLVALADTMWPPR